MTPSLTATDLADAIRWARTGTPAPYVLYLNPERTHPAGFVYTPFVRAAIAAKTAMAEGRHATPATIADAASDPLVYLALDWYPRKGSPLNLCNTVGEGEPCLRDQRLFGFAPRVIDGAVRGTAVGGETGGIVEHPDPAAWITRDFAVLSRFGAILPEGHADHIAAVAAFPREDFVPGHYIGACVFVDSHCMTYVGVVIASDFAQWR